jgi:phosphoenolpyruvate carboxykinase (ATP)
MDKIHLKRNAPVSLLYEDAIRNEGAIISSTGSLINFSGKKTGRSPKDKRIVFEETSKDDIWWGSVNIKLDERKLSPQLKPGNPGMRPIPLDRHFRDQP